MSAGPSQFIIHWMGQPSELKIHAVSAQFFGTSKKSSSESQVNKLRCKRMAEWVVGMRGSVCVAQGGTLPFSVSISQRGLTSESFVSLFGFDQPAPGLH